MTKPVAVKKPPNSTENTKPEVFADFLVQWAEDPECNVSVLAKRCGLPRRTARDIVNRLETRYQPVTEEVKKVTTQSLLKLMDDALPGLLSKLSDKELIDKSAMREIAMAAGILIDKRQLLRGEPTQILSLDQRQKMDDLAPALLGEMKRRGITVDVDFEDITPIPVEKVSRTARHQAKREDRGRV